MDLPPLSLSTLLGILLVLVLLHALYAHLTDPLRSVPGPLVARYTNLWRLVRVWRGYAFRTYIALHERAPGGAVRIGPRCVSLADPALIRTIYDTRGTFLKSGFYEVNGVLPPGQKGWHNLLHSVFSTQSNAEHDRQVRPIKRLYNLAGMRDYEPGIDGVLSHLCEELDRRFAKTRLPCPLHDWINYYGWDVVGQVTYSKPLGFLDVGTDVHGILDSAGKSLDYFSVIGQMPWLDKLLDKNPLTGPIFSPSFDVAVGMSVQQIQARVAGTDAASVEEKESGRQRTPDFLDHFLSLRRASPDAVPEHQVLMWILLNMFAGSDTTAIALRTVFYYILKHPRAHARLVDELHSVLGRDATAAGPVSYDDARRLPYLSAAISEATRVFPGLGLSLERIVPDGGLALPNGCVLPAGTVVGINPFVVQRDRAVFGDDAHEFRPERWLRGDGEDEDAFAVRLRNMRNTILMFGAGKRVCLGKHLAEMSLWKVTATLFSRYKLRLRDPEREWTLNGSWFIRQSDMDVIIEMQ